jgi:hypothetical protein
MKAVFVFPGVFFCFLAAFLSGCEAVAPAASAVSVRSQTEVKLQDGNFIVLRTNVVGVSKGFRLLGFITLCPATVNEAMNHLYAAAEAQEGRPETLAHLMVEHSGVYVILFSIPEVTVRADLIEFLPAENDTPPPEEGPSNAHSLRPVGGTKRRN